MDISESKGFSYLKESSWERKSISKVKKYEIHHNTNFKSYPSCETIHLPLAWELDEARISPLIQQRRSLRRYANKPLTLEDLSFLLWASQGVSAKVGKHSLRTSPSAGALYPFETYLIVDNVQGLEQGLYHFNVEDFSLELIKKASFARKFADSCLNQTFVAKAPVSFVWTGVLSRCFGKYGERALRYLLLDIGHICQNILLAAEAVSCGGCPVAAFYDDEVHEILGVDGDDEIAIYAVPVGKKK